MHLEKGTVFDIGYQLKLGVCGAAWDTEEVHDSLST